jgi:hypothetical protein
MSLSWQWSVIDSDTGTWSLRATQCWPTSPKLGLEANTVQRSSPSPGAVANGDENRMSDHASGIVYYARGECARHWFTVADAFHFAFIDSECLAASCIAERGVARAWRRNLNNENENEEREPSV